MQPNGESLSLPCINSALSNNARKNERSPKNCNEWEKQLEEGMQEFETHYEAQMEALRETLRTKRETHKSRMAEMEHNYVADQQSAFDEAKQRMLNKINEFDLEVVGAQV